METYSSISSSFSFLVGGSCNKLYLNITLSVVANIHLLSKGSCVIKDFKSTTSCHMVQRKTKKFLSTIFLVWKYKSRKTAVLRISSPEQHILLRSIEFARKHNISYVTDIRFATLSSGEQITILNTCWTRLNPASSLLCLDKANLSPILFCTGAINWMSEEVKPNKCLIILKKIALNK